VERGPEIFFNFRQAVEKTFFEGFGHGHGKFLLNSTLNKKRGTAPLFVIILLYHAGRGAFI
jgi:hypothetical protein